MSEGFVLAIHGGAGVRPLEGGQHRRGREDQEQRGGQRPPTVGQELGIAHGRRISSLFSPV